jgi:tRNA threonylcarbamoyl adenosine modification protein YeaZ
MTHTFTLVLETSTPHASLATLEPTGLLLEREFTSDRSHNAVLFAPLQELLNARLEPQIGLVLVGSGPGSYSGTRVGIAAAQGVAIASACPAVAVPSILAVPSAENGATCLAIGDARRGSYWTARVGLHQLSHGPELTDASGLIEIVAQAVADGIAIFSFEEPSRFPLPSDLIDQVRLEFPSAGRLLKAWQAASPVVQAQWASESPQPIYLKPPHITPAKRPWLVQPAQA